MQRLLPVWGIYGVCCALAVLQMRQGQIVAGTDRAADILGDAGHDAVCDRHALEPSLLPKNGEIAFRGDVSIVPACRRAAVDVDGRGVETGDGEGSCLSAERLSNFLGRGTIQF